MERKSWGHGNEATEERPKEKQECDALEEMSKEERIHCAKCGRQILKTDNYCMYCRTPTRTKSF